MAESEEGTITQGPVEDAAYFLERVEIDDDSEDDFVYEEVPVEDSDDEDDMDDAHDVDLAVQSALAQTQDRGKSASTTRTDLTPTVTKRPELVDDFIRNFLIKNNLTNTLDHFQNEWYEKKAKGEVQEEPGTTPDIYLRNQELEDRARQLQQELQRAREIAEKARSTWDKFRKERDFHRMHHRRVVQEKNKLIGDMKRLRSHYERYEPALRELQRKYEKSMKEKMLMRLERDKLIARSKALEESLRKSEQQHEGARESGADKTKKSRRKKHPHDSFLPEGERDNPHLSETYESAAVERYSLQKTFKGHLMAVSDVALHPSKPIVATASDDTTWKMWALPNGELIMSGDGHKDWIAGIAFHPSETHLATASGDSTVKLWNFAESTCQTTFIEHTQAVWSCAFHDMGDFLVSSSMDQTAKMWDINSERCRQTFRGHVDSVNAVCFQPFSNNVCTASSDKTVSLWDARTGLCIQTFYGHLNSCNHAAFNLRGDLIASTDADGVVKLWDVRMVSERTQLYYGPHAANCAAFDKSGNILAVAMDDGAVKLYHVLEEKAIGELRGHADAVQTVLFDHQNNFVISGGSDNTFRLWS